jgi:hypothetical protein
MVRDQNDTTGEKEREYANLLRQEQLRDRVQQMYAPDFDFTPPYSKIAKLIHQKKKGKRRRDCVEQGKRQKFLKRTIMWGKI